ncbi:hypothetical protein [Acinetobacter sp. YH01021]|nr:hypothetical protein [Acinetobacter sp. YH01021]
MNKSTFDEIVINRLYAEDFAQPAKQPLHVRIWRKLCVVKTA